MAWCVREVSRLDWSATSLLADAVLGSSDELLDLLGRLASVLSDHVLGVTGVLSSEVFKLGSLFVDAVMGIP